MSVKIRLARHGAKKAPFYRVVIADERAPRNGRFIEVIGRYNPNVKPIFLEIDTAKADEWIAKGAQPTEAATKLIAIAKGEKEAPTVEKKPSKKSVAKAEAEKQAAEEAKKAAEEEKKAAEEAKKAEAEAAAAAAEEAPAEEPAAEDAPAEETPAEEAPAEESAE